ncbi:MAG: hypothetical protein IKH01_10410 [Prevotella sp.]|jgi:ADP-ribose pyrophosphatase YjhB (NUDIX family)|nr:hypothetical protein [Prevotella sp.]MBR3080200.1 hypothetical protein [Prevotella sp.]
MKKLLFVMITLLALSACQESMDERCAREAREYTKKKCPVLITRGVTIDSMVFYPDTRTIAYYYTAEGVIDDAEALKKHDLRGIMLKELRNSANLKDYKEAGYNFSYIYYSTKNKGTRLFEATFQKKDYQ